MKHLLIALSSSVLLAGCAGVRVSDTQIASGAAHPRSIYIRPFEVAATNYHGQHRGGAGEKPIRQSLAGREFAEALQDELAKIAPAILRVFFGVFLCFIRRQDSKDVWSDGS